MKQSLTVALFSTLLLATSCKNSIQSLDENPSSHLGDTVRVSGVVSERIDWPFTEHDYFKIVDGNHGVWVHGDSPPPKGSHVTVMGRWTRGEDCYSDLVPYVICETDRSID